MTRKRYVKLVRALFTRIHEDNKTKCLTLSYKPGNITRICKIPADKSHQECWNILSHALEGIAVVGK